MTSNPEGGNTASQARRALAASAIFYILIAFEFFYMASPFAAYLYAVYGPGLDWLQSSTLTSWSIGFFLPHIVAETRSVVIDVHGIVGQVLFAGGLGGLAIGAFQIYRAKLRRADAVDAVQGGLYRHIRHPQYLALVGASIGMVLIWPRYLVLFLTVTVIFIYIALAKAEEAICLRRFPGYAGYLEGTGMFLPVRLPRNLLLPADAGVMRRVATWGLAYAVALGLALVAASGLRTLALDSLYAMSADGDVYVSVVEIGDGDLAAGRRTRANRTGGAGGDRRSRASAELRRAGKHVNLGGPNAAPGRRDVRPCGAAGLGRKDLQGRFHRGDSRPSGRGRASARGQQDGVVGSPCGPACVGSHRDLSATRGAVLRRPTGAGVLTRARVP